MAFRFRAAVVDHGHEPSDPGKTWRTLGFVAGGAGVVGLGAGVFFLLQKGSQLRERDDVCPSGVCAAGTGADSQARIHALTADARSSQTVASVAFVGGGVLLAAGGTLLLAAPKAEGQRKSSGLRLLPVAEPGRYGVFARGAF